MVDGRGAKIHQQLAQRYILTEFGFVTAVFICYSVLIIRNYSANLKFFLGHQQRILQQVSSGRTDISVPVTSNDEFGVIARHTNLMIEGLAAKTLEVRQTRDVAILGLASLAETRDNETGLHIIRTQNYVKALAEWLYAEGHCRNELNEESIELIFKSAPLHDIGKVGIPDAVLLKPGKLTDEEWQIMKQHPQIGKLALERAEEQLGSNSFLRYAGEIALSHHEKWDGSGYPEGLVGEEIPLSARLMALADVYDALISKRVYKEAFSHQKAREIILEGEASHFDPLVVTAFIACEAEFRAIAEAHSDSAH
ncbi:HD domain-containing phosphohydrolase [Dongshaea marina]|uniref:HD domain-containing phosphohydrolase n=1 Tax=Dongshaea marina TaxID=2047966 RepID=UPI001F227C70|nr:HD domain-containing phosphohydrolase [Dongshaea marina]